MAAGGGVRPCKRCSAEIKDITVTKAELVAKK